MPGTVEHLLEQTAEAGVSARKMFGEYALFCQGRLVALVCDDQLFVKPTTAGRAYIGTAIEAAPYPGAKACLLIPGDRWDDREWLTGLIRVSAEALPLPAPNKRRRMTRSGEAGV